MLRSGLITLSTSIYTLWCGRILDLRPNAFGGRWNLHDPCPQARLRRAGAIGQHIHTHSARRTTPPPVTPALAAILCTDPRFSGKTSQGVAPLPPYAVASHPAVHTVAFTAQLGREPH